MGYFEGDRQLVQVELVPAHEPQTLLQEAGRRGAKTVTLEFVDLLAIP